MVHIMLSSPISVGFHFYMRQFYCSSFSDDETEAQMGPKLLKTSRTPLT